MPVINFVNEKKQIEVPEGTNLRRAALDAGVQLYPFPHNYLNCHGFAQCGSCRVLVTKGMENTSDKGMFEKARLALSFAYIGNEETMRLSCQTKVEGDIDVVTTPPMNLYGENFFS
ncbi:MAG: (2Fe-2S)-binding protein [Pirellulales bacterium]|nr:(2Fe-2S)-binding protein [Pirellulales bacterium]